MGSLFLVRHATTTASAAGVNLGQRNDAPVTPEGRELARRTGEAIGQELETLGISRLRLLTSPARRCRQTADGIVAANPGRFDGAEVEPGLWELDYGAWEGLTAEECQLRDPELRQRWEDDPYATTTPGGESGADVARRASAVLDPLERWLGDDATRGALVVSHNHVVRVRLAALLGLPPADYRRRIVTDPGGYSLITFTPDRPVARRINVLPL